mgnify:CR=1 FL=1
MVGYIKIMNIKNMSLIVLASIILGVVAGFLAQSIVVGILLPVLLVVFYAMWKYMKFEPEVPKEEDILKGVKTENPQASQQPTYYQEPKDKV